MNKIDALLDLLSKIYQILQYYHLHQEKFLNALPDQKLTRQEVKDYLGISEST
ncbi:MAG: DNA-binding protein, partial [Chitinophagaceae bacterium]